MLEIAANLYPWAEQSPEDAEYDGRQSLDSHEWTLNSKYLRWIFPFGGLQRSILPSSLVSLPLLGPTSIGPGHPGGEVAVPAGLCIPSLVLRVLLQIQTEWVTNMVIVPWWSRHPWSPLLLEFSVVDPIPLPGRLLQNEHLLLNVQCLHLMAWKLRQRFRSLRVPEAVIATLLKSR